MTTLALCYYGCWDRVNNRCMRVFSLLDKEKDGMTLRTLLTGMTLLVFVSAAVVPAHAATTDADQIGQVQRGRT